MSLALAKKFVIDTRMNDRALYADDFVTEFAHGPTLDGAAVLSIMHAVIEAGPDFSFNATNWNEEDGAVTVDARVSATMTKTLSHPQFGEIEPTGKKATLGIERLTLRFKDGKVASMSVTAEGPAGPPELIRQWTC